MCIQFFFLLLFQDIDRGYPCGLPSNFAILHMVGGAVNSTINLVLQEYDRKHQPSHGHIEHETV